ncbi:hypothetical protein PAE2775 [Pyrobaculum aerophilum str. IM2]|uniref:Uncharacterized protein n=2 Tax=Pyrobaculum aerophilum TaxID=13773 RepID=Q8ZUI1_PYRAE|nr:hypothetical protein [Pyrobaculum aerophilum]AAL64426.1 hypothetical protein PAE2775 [Pyrobaculum aerophilum str. IM2]HII47284.1 hypothetical protein [Pyrobaculum aerophilum]
MCTLYGREGYHGLFLRPIAAQMGCELVQLDYMALHRTYRRGAPGVFYIEDVWYKHGSAPWPRHAVPEAFKGLMGRIYPVLGNVQVFYTDGTVNYVAEAQCGKAGLLAKRGEPLVTDLLLPLYLEIGDVAKALIAAKKFYKCGLPSTPAELVEGIYSGHYKAAYFWLGWAPGVKARPNPVLKKALAGFWGLTVVAVEVDVPDSYAYPPPYLDVDWGPYAHNRRLVEEASPLRGRGWMDFVEEVHGVIHAYLHGQVELEKATRITKRIEGVLRDVGEGLY